MGRPSLTFQHYSDIAKKKNLVFLGKSVPHFSSTPTRWRCALTGVVMVKSYNTVKKTEHGSRYQRTHRNDLLKYTRLAERLCIEFVYDPVEDYFPANNKTPCYWRGPSGLLVEATYQEIGYGSIPERLQSLLGLHEGDEVQYVT